MAKFTGLSCDAGRLGQLVDARVATLAGHIMLPIIAERYARSMPLRALPTPPGSRSSPAWSTARRLRSSS